MRKTLIAVAVLLVLASQAQAADPVPYISLAVGNSLDFLTTQQAFNRGAVEANPLMANGSLQQIAATKAITTGVLVLTVYFLQKTGHPKTAHWLGLIDGGATGFIAWHNNGVGR